MIKFSHRLALSALLLSTLSGVAHADDPPPPPPQDVWFGKGSLGAVVSRGNSEATTLSAAVDATELSGDWKYQLGGSALRADTSGVTSADRYELHGQTDYSLTPRSYLFGALRYDDDHFSAYNYQATATGGYGYKWIDDADTKLATELGVGYRRSKLRLDGSQNGDAILRAGVNFEHSFNAATKIFDKFLLESGKDDTFITNDIGINVKMSSKLALGLDYIVRNHSKVPDETVKKTDTLLTANIVFSF